LAKTSNLFSQLVGEAEVDIETPIHWWDWLLFAIITAVALLETQAREDLYAPGLVFVLAVIVALCIVVRHRYKLTSFLVAFLVMLSHEAAAFFLAVPWDQLNTMAFALVLPFSLSRFASGKKIIIGFAVIVPFYLLVKAIHPQDITDGLLGLVVLLFPVVMAAAFRFRDKALSRERKQIKLQEREQIARELHDSVAHHLTAVIIQAQAALAVVDHSVQAVKPALHDIELSAKDALREMRGMLSALRTHSAVDYMPQQGIQDLKSLADDRSELKIDVLIDIELTDIEQLVSFACYRIVQESITNIRKHAKNATHVQVLISHDGNALELSIRDNGAIAADLTRPPQAFGLIGMAERVAILKGEFSAGWTATGWQVKARLPLTA